MENTNKFNHHTFILGMVSGAVLAILIMTGMSANASRPKDSGAGLVACPVTINGALVEIKTTDAGCMKLQAALNPGLDLIVK